MRARLRPLFPLNPPGVTIDTIRAAQARLAGHVENTPCLHSRTLSEITGAEVYLKFENLQFTASFKERGALNKLSTLTAAQKARGVMAVSAGNHAQGVAYHAQRLGIPAVIVMPRFSPMVKIERTRGFGAEVVLSGDTFDDSKAEAARLAAERSLTMVHPYDDVDVIAGQGTIALEMIEAMNDLDAVVRDPHSGGVGRQRGLHVMNRNLDKVRLSEDAFINGHPGGQLGLGALSSTNLDYAYAVTAVPEPHVAALPVLAGLGWLLRRRRIRPPGRKS